MVCLLAAGVLLMLGVSACQSPHGSPSPYLAAITVTNRTLTQVETATYASFKEQGFRAYRQAQGEFLFEREGTSMNNVVYGDWSMKRPWERIKVYIKESLPGQRVRVGCNAYMVREHGDPRFEEEQKLSRLHRGHYEDLLEKVYQLLPEPSRAP